MARPFKGLRNGPQDSYNVIVIGAGIGGLICANLLARDGLRVLLIEQHYMVGGYCSTFRRKGYTFDAATHFYPLLGNPNTMTGKLLLDLGITTKWVKMDPVDQFHFPDGSFFSVPADFDRYLTQLKIEFPEEVGALNDFFAVVKKAYMLGLLYYFRGRDTPRLDAYRDLTVQQVLDQHFRSRKLKLLLTADCPHWGSAPSRTSFVFDSMLRLSYFLGNYYPRGGSQAFADELAQRFEERGGHILMRSLVNRILVKNGTAFGVEVETGRPRNRYVKRVSADLVVSNSDLLYTLERMLGPKHLDADYLAPIRKLRPSYPCFLTHIGLKGIDAEVLREAHGYYWNSWDAGQVGRNGLKFKVFIPTLYEPRMARHGGHVMIIQKVLDIDYRAINDWASHKATIERYVMDNLEQIIPGINEKVVVKLSASALTSHQFTLNYQGAMLGWEMSPDQLGDQRLDVVSPIKNLYFVGHWVQPGGGITPVIVSAMKVAKIITSQLTIDNCQQEMRL
ncbi:NAD(P)/FAD-dependent oxidoreductase [Candidatus Poribacteria bacterium]|nr:NAD(P)/FAD-dependent oxidoreductase [Candidatus Poribacteria bacterium]